MKTKPHQLSGIFQFGKGKYLIQNWISTRFLMLNMFAFICLLFPSLLFAQKEQIQRIKTDIDSVTIFISAAEINQSKNVKLLAGSNLILFEEISPKLQVKSIRVTTPEDVSLLSISSKTNYLSNTSENPRIQQLKDSVKLISAKLSTLNDELDALKIEKEMLLKNTSLAGTNNGVVINDLKAAADYFRTRITEINTLSTDKNTKVEKFTEVNNKLQMELNELNAQYSFERSEIAVLVSVDKPMNATIVLKYLVSDAGWAPSYDIKASDINKPVDFVYRAKVYNNTGITWSNVKIKLSTADPSLDVTKPVLIPWYLNYNSYTFRTNNQNEGYSQNMIQSDLGDLKLPSGGTSVTFTEIEVPELSAEFNIKTKYSIPSDAKPYLVEVMKQELSATFKHHAVTKVDKDVFLLAQITGWADLNLIEGPANIYYAGTYIGESFIKTRNVSDTLDISLGRDSKVLVTRTKLKEYSSEQLIGSKITEVRVYEMVAKNNRKVPISLDIFDQIPISQTEEIEVKILETSKAEYNPTTGELKWHFNLQPGQSEKVKLSFSMKYPKNKKQEIMFERKRSMLNAPKF